MLFSIVWERCKKAIPANAPILYMYGAFGKRLSRTDSVNELFKNRRATVSLGYIGLYEVASAFFGGEWETNPEAKAFTLDIVKRLKANADAWGMNMVIIFSVYSTPSESLTDPFLPFWIQKNSGIIENITDKKNIIQTVSTMMCVKPNAI